jgi:sugar/nucleoside kinase (ribokinase family)
MGAAHLDWKIRLGAKLVAGESNPATVTTRAGGVANNIFNTLRHLGRAPEFVGLEPDASRVYLAVEGPEGNLEHGIACLESYDELNAEFLRDQAPRLANADWLIVDCNCREDLFELLPDVIDDSTKLVLVAVSPAKLPRLVPALGRANWLFCNAAEWETLLAFEWNLPADLNVVKTVGRDGVERLLGLTVTSRHPVPQSAEALTDLTGPGDSLCALVVHGLCDGLSPDRAIDLALEKLPATLSALHAN